MPLTFVVSTGRCGSTMLSRILHMHPDVLSISEFFTTLTIATRRYQFPTGEMDGPELWRLLSADDSFFTAVTRAGWDIPELCYPYERGRYDRDAGVPMICNTTLPMLTDDPDALYDELADEVRSWPRRAAADQYRALFAWLARRLGRSVVVERSGNSTNYIGAMREQFPEARFVHMYRDGRDCALSMSRHPMFRRGALTLQAARSVGKPFSSWDELEAMLPEEYTGLVVPPYDGNRIMDHEIPMTYFGEMWSAAVGRAVPALTELPPDIWINLAYEELLNDPDKHLTRLADFLDVPAAPEWFDAARRLIDPRRAGKATELDAGATAELETSCRPGNDALAALTAPA